MSEAAEPVPRPQQGDRTTQYNGSAGPERITQVLLACRDGDREAFSQLMSLVYNELRRIAHRQLRRDRPGLTLNTTGLVHEAYLKLVDHAQVGWQDRSHFFAVCARAMRQIIIDHAKRRCAQKRGGHAVPVALEEEQLEAQKQAVMLVKLDDALAGLASLDERLVRVVECRFFAGYTEKETAEVLAVSRRTVQRDWQTARAWLRHEIGAGPEATD